MEFFSRVAISRYPARLVASKSTICMAYLMLANFFRLNGQTHDISSAPDFLKHFQTTNEMRNVVLRFDPFELQRPQSRISQKRFINVSFSKKVIKNLEFIDCDFEDCLFIGSELVNCRFTNCRFKGCNPHRISDSEHLRRSQVFCKYVGRQISYEYRNQFV